MQVRGNIHCRCMMQLPSLVRSLWGAHTMLRGKSDPKRIAEQEPTCNVGPGHFAHQFKRPAPRVQDPMVRCDCIESRLPSVMLPGRKNDANCLPT